MATGIRITVGLGVIVDSENKSGSMLRWYVTGASALVLGIAGLVVGCSIESKHPDDRLMDMLVPTLIFSTFGLLAGFVTSLVIERRFGW